MEDQERALRHIRAELDKKKREIFQYYTTTKLKLPPALRNATIGQLREEGAIVDPDIFIPDRYKAKIAGSIRQQIDLKNKLTELREEHIRNILNYYRDVKKNLPPEIRNTRLSELGQDGIKLEDLIK